MGREFPHMLGLKRLRTLLLENREPLQWRGHTRVSSSQKFGYEVNLYLQPSNSLGTFLNIYKSPAMISGENYFPPAFSKYLRFYY